VLSASKTVAYYADPYKGEIIGQAAVGPRKFMEAMTSWHRWLAMEGDSRSIGKGATGLCNIAFLFLAFSGLYLWFPRKRSLQAFQAVVALNFKLQGKARDWNWHNVIGFWSAPVLIVLTGTALVISQSWASNLVYRMAGAVPPGAPGKALEQLGANVLKPIPDAKPATPGMLISAVQREFPRWEKIIYRAPGGIRGGEAPNKAAGDNSNSNARKGNAPGTPIILSVQETGANPKFAMTQVSLNPYTAEILKREDYSDYNGGRKARVWIRFLHTGEALGLPGQAVAGAASCMGLFLVYTGYALSWRRFLARKSKEPLDIKHTFSNSKLERPSPLGS
jgi:uncharacterized iron-regulated membrane protein